MNIWSVNTNSNEDNGNPNGFLIMLRQNRVATYYQRADDVGNIQNGDLILLYHNNNRVIAVGYALQNSRHDFIDIASIERWVDVNWIWKANFNELLEPTNSISRNNLKFISVRRAVNNITGEIDIIALLTEIGKRQAILI